MNKENKRTIWNIIFAAFGITAASLYFDLRRFLWRLWAVLSGIWVTLLLLVAATGSEEGLLPQLQHGPFWIGMLAPPIGLLIVAVLLNWIINGLRDDTIGNGKNG